MKRLPILAAATALTLTLIVGLPLFLRTPVWVDVTYHDVSARNVLSGGVHYRDVFETNLPGMVWLHCLVRPVLGWSHEAIRAADLVVIGGVCLLLSRLLRGSGVSVSGQVWFLTAAGLFYLFETEFIHCQRDGWMLLPAVLATTLRTRAQPHAAYGFLEGIIWGCAVWIKPHVLVPALFVWLVSLRFHARRENVRTAVGLLAGGLTIGAAGVFWLVRTGTWPHLWDVLTNWNAEYYRWTWANVWYRMKLVTAYFPPFSAVHFAAIPVGLVALFRRDPNRALLAALYLGWLGQATFIQKEFDYAHAPPTLLGLAVLAAHRWPVGPVFLVWCIVGGVVNEAAGKSEWFTRLDRTYPMTTRMVVPAHATVRTDRLRLWPRCGSDSSWELKDRLTHFHDVHCAPDWADLHRVAEFLRSKGVGDGDLICWHDTTHPLYVELGVKPGFRFPHVITAMKFRSKLDVIRAEAFASPARYVVSDLVPVTYSATFGPAPPPGPASELPPEFPGWGADVYPWNQPVVFRAGRYFVHEIKAPKGEIEFPLPDVLKE